MGISQICQMWQQSLRLLRCKPPGETCHGREATSASHQCRCWRAFSNIRCTAVQPRSKWGCPFRHWLVGRQEGHCLRRNVSFQDSLVMGSYGHCIAFLLIPPFFFFCSCNMKPFKLVCNQSISCQQNRELVRVECRHPAILYHPCFPRLRPLADGLMGWWADGLMG